MVDDPNQPVTLPAPPELFMIPQALLDQWGEIPPADRLNFQLTRQEIDHLLVGLLRSFDAQALLERTLVEWSNGQKDQANKTLSDFRRANVEGQNHIRQLAAAIMASALRERVRG